MANNYSGNNWNMIYLFIYRRKEGNVLFNDALKTFYLRLYGVGHMVRKDMFYLTTYSTHYIYGYMASDIYGKGPLI